MIIGVISARYLKWSSFWMIIHVVCSLVVIIATVVSSNVQIQFDQVPLSSLTANKLASSRLGFSIAALLVAQGLFGILTLFFN